LCVVGSPLLIGRVWEKWRRLGWLALLLTVVGIAACLASWDPDLRVQVWDSQTQSMEDSFHPVLAIGGWLAAMFGIAFNPAIGLRGDHRWA
jgi:hypothetical protein